MELDGGLSLDFYGPADADKNNFDNLIATLRGTSSESNTGTATLSVLLDELQLYTLEEALKHSIFVHTLHMPGCGIDDVGAEAISRALKSNSVLLHLDLTGNEIGRVGAMALAQSLASANCTLRRLDLAGNPCAREAVDIISTIHTALKRNAMAAEPVGTPYLTPAPGARGAPFTPFATPCVVQEGQCDTGADPPSGFRLRQIESQQMHLMEQVERCLTLGMQMETWKVQVDLASNQLGMVLGMLEKEHSALRYRVDEHESTLLGEDAEASRQLPAAVDGLRTQLNTVEAAVGELQAQVAVNAAAVADVQQEIHMLRESHNSTVEADRQVDHPVPFGLLTAPTSYPISVRSSCATSALSTPLPSPLLSPVPTPVPTDDEGSARDTHRARKSRLTMSVDATITPWLELARDVKVQGALHAQLLQQVQQMNERLARLESESGSMRKIMNRVRSSSKQLLKHTPRAADAESTDGSIAVSLGALRSAHGTPGGALGTPRGPVFNGSSSVLHSPLRNASDDMPRTASYPLLGENSTDSESLPAVPAVIMSASKRVPPLKGAPFANLTSAVETLSFDGVEGPSPGPSGGPKQCLRVETQSNAVRVERTFEGAICTLEGAVEGAIEGVGSCEPSPSEGLVSTEFTQSAVGSKGSVQGDSQGAAVENSRRNSSSLDSVLMGDDDAVLTGECVPSVKTLPPIKTKTTVIDIKADAQIALPQPQPATSPVLPHFTQATRPTQGPAQGPSTGPSAKAEPSTDPAQGPSQAATQGPSHGPAQGPSEGPMGGATPTGPPRPHHIERTASLAALRASATKIPTPRPGLSRTTSLSTPRLSDTKIPRTPRVVDGEISSGNGKMGGNVDTGASKLSTCSSIPGSTRNRLNENTPRNASPRWRITSTATGTSTPRSRSSVLKNITPRSAEIEQEVSTVDDPASLRLSPLLSNRSSVEALSKLGILSKRVAELRERLALE